MERITMTIDEDLLQTLDTLVERHSYASRSEALRDMIRDSAIRDAASVSAAPCVAILGYVYDHETRALAQSLTQSLHDHHDLVVAGMHVHLDHDSCLEVSVLKGSMRAARKLTDLLTAQRGVRQANLHVIPVKAPGSRHDHGAGTARHSHVHAR